MNVATLAPVVKTVTVPLAQDRAFYLFVSEMATWWPLETHSVSGDRASSCTFEGHVGGRIYETADSGAEHDWGRVTEWDPGRRVVFHWFPGRAESTAQLVEITFTSVPGGTTLELTHTGWEAVGDRAVELRASYDSGWEETLGRFAAAATP